MAIDWKDIRYRGDVADVEELFKTYRVEDYLKTYEENLRQRDRGMRERLLKEGIRLTENLSPRIHRIFKEVCEALLINGKEEIFCLPEQHVNAYAVLDIQESGTNSLIGITAGALEKLDDTELKSILGHEFGHFLFGNNRLDALISRDQNNPSATVLPPFGESLFLRWRKKAEISADRVGLLAAGDFHASAKTLIKGVFGLSERNLNLNIEALLQQVDEIRGHPEIINETFTSHPLLPIRLKAIELFSRSEKAKRNGFPAPGDSITDDGMENAIDELIRITRRYPYKPLHEAVMRTIALAGAMLLSTDRDISDEEVKILVQILHYYFTDEPEKEIVTDRKQIEEKLPRVIETIKEKGEEDDKTFVLSRLADIALADGALMDSEGAVILQVGEWLGLTPRESYRIIVQAAQSVGFQTDVKLNRIAEELRRSLQVGCKI
jgi:uncharacterized tellurite resistance protein B-like protein